MSYKVSYYTLALMGNKGIGNINQGSGHVFTDKSIMEIPDALNEYLKPKERVGVVSKIEDVGGDLLK